MAKPKKGNHYDDWLSLLVFFFILLFILAFFDNINLEEREELHREKNKLLQTITANDLSENNVAFIIRNRVDKNRLTSFASRDYEEVKTYLGINKDFALFFSNGNNTIIPISGKVCIGSQKAKVGGIRCG